METRRLLVLLGMAKHVGANAIFCFLVLYGWCACTTVHIVVSVAF